MDKYIYGADTETCKGEPMTLQFYSEDCDCEDIYFVSAKSSFQQFLAWCSRRRRNIEHIVYVHNLDFDAIEFLWRPDLHKLMAAPGGEFYVKEGKWSIRGCYGTPTFFRVTNGHDIAVTFIDSYSYFKGSLAAAAELFCHNLPKLKRPDGLGEKLFKKSNAKFCDYAMRDAVVAYHMGRAIELVHQQFDIRQTVSIADMSARIFRHRFVHQTIPLCPAEMIDPALYSYHGGKNNLAVEPGWYTGVSSLDISSAYPHAMSELPSFTNEKLYKKYRGTKSRGVPSLGIYRVSGLADSCRWPSLFDHSFKSIEGRFDAVWVAGYELNEAIRTGEARINKISGWYYESDKDLERSPFRAFVEEFYEKKERETDKVKRTFYKLILNSLYGKFIQTRKNKKFCRINTENGVVTEVSDLVAGGLFHPFIASLITAHTRARIHELEHKYEALHTATDGIFTQRPVNGIPSKAAHLGGLTREAVGDLLLARNKLYILYGDKKKYPDAMASRSFKDKSILKYALHGFQGKIHDLEKLVATNRRKYTITRPNRLKESVKRGLVPNLFEDREMILKVPPLSVKK